MRALTSKQFRLAAAAAVMAIGLSTAALAGDQGGSKDRVPNTPAYTNYSTSTDDTATPCQTCYSGAGLSGTQNKQPYSVTTTPRCQSCVKGS